MVPVWRTSAKSVLISICHAIAAHGKTEAGDAALRARRPPLDRLQLEVTVEFTFIGEGCDQASVTLIAFVGADLRSKQLSGKRTYASPTGRSPPR